MNVKQTLVAVVAGIAMAVGTIACSATRTQKAPGEQIDDAVVLGNVKSALISDPVTEAREIDVEVRRGVVQLNGFVDSAKEKSQAATVASGVKGVMEVQNNLVVGKDNTTVGGVIDDSILTAKVKAKLIESDKTKAHQINVETKLGVVHLSGFVDTANAKAAASEIALSVSGVKDVKNEISVKTS
jgi:hyperosmotically inducible periplasmic protein